MLRIDYMKKVLIYLPFTYPTISAKVFKSFTEMISPSNQAILAERGYRLLDPYISGKFPMCFNRNEAFEACQNSKEADLMFCCDGDQVFKKDTLLKLLDTMEEYPEAGGVTGVYFTKSFPHRAVVGKYSPWSDKLEPKRAALASQGFIAPDGSQTLYFKHLQYFDVVQQVDVFGLGCFLFRPEILKKIQQPYCKYVNEYSTGGDYTFHGHSEDMWFCSQLKKSGVKILVNPKVIVGHVTEKVIYGNEGEE